MIGTHFWTHAGTANLDRWHRPLAVVLTTLALAWGVSQVIEYLTNWQAVEPIIGVDYRIYMHAATRWLGGGGFYMPYQLAPYTISGYGFAEAAILYPPTALLLFMPFTILPSILWWAIPIAVTGWVVWKHQPRPLVWPVIAFLVTFPTTIHAIATGNPTLWITMALALGTVYGWPSVLVLLKPTLAPLALIGVWRRSWWLALLGLGAVSLVFLPMWGDYLKVLANTGSTLGPFYSFNQLPTLFIPIFAWLGRPRSHHSPRSAVP